MFIYIYKITVKIIAKKEFHWVEAVSERTGSNKTEQEKKYLGETDTISDLELQLFVTV